MKSINVYNSELPSEICKIKDIIEDVTSGLINSIRSLDGCLLFDLKVILSEMLINAIRHGNKEDDSKFIKVKVGMCEDRLVFFIVEDEGLGYDYNLFKNNEVANRGKDLFDMTENGRGILIVNGLCDSVGVNRKGNKIVAVKRLYEALS